ncbi:MAG: HepT-like ribonuclease domain-containing protein [Geminicoccales bacterium]
MIERNIARISEAARFVPNDVRAKYPAIPWRRIVGIGNVIRHDYDDIDDRVMWDTATGKLLPLKEAVESVLREVEEGGLE